MNLIIYRKLKLYPFTVVSEPFNFLSMFVPSPSIDVSCLRDHSLILPVVSIGNVGQLAIDILLSTLFTAQSLHSNEANGENDIHCTDNERLIIPLGSVYSTNISPYAGYEIFDRTHSSHTEKYFTSNNDNDPLNRNDSTSIQGHRLLGKDEKKTLCTSLELYLLPQSKHVLLQQRSSIVPSRRQEFIQELFDWMKEVGMRDLILLSGSGMHKHEEVLPQSQIERLSYLDLYFEREGKETSTVQQEGDKKSASGDETKNNFKKATFQRELENLNIPCLNKAIHLQPPSKLTLNYPDQNSENDLLRISSHQNEKDLLLIDKKDAIKSTVNSLVNSPSHCGMSKLYFESCKNNGIGGYIFLYRCSEGDNVGDGAFILSFLISLLKLNEFADLQSIRNDTIEQNIRFTLPRSFELLEGERRNISL